MLDQRLKQLIKSQEEHNNSYFVFLRNITTISVGLFGLLVGLKPDIIPVYNAKIAFMATIISLGLAIVFSIISQFYEVYIKKEDKKAKAENLVKELRNEDSNKFGYLPRPRFFFFSEIMTYIFLGTTIVSLVIYVYIIEFL